jgi:hypothetical protein
LAEALRSAQELPPAWRRSVTGDVQEIGRRVADTCANGGTRCSRFRAKVMVSFLGNAAAAAQVGAPSDSCCLAEQPATGTVSANQPSRAQGDQR